MFDFLKPVVHAIIIVAVLPISLVFIIFKLANNQSDNLIVALKRNLD